MPEYKSIGFGTLCGSLAVLPFAGLVAVMKYVLYVGDIAGRYGDTFWGVVHVIGFDLLASYLLPLLFNGVFGAILGAIIRTLYGRVSTIAGLLGLSVGMFCGLTLTPGSAYAVGDLLVLGTLWVGYLASAGAVVLVRRKTLRKGN